MKREEALNLIQHKLDLAVDDALIMTDEEYKVFSLCAKALEKEVRLDKIRAEIEFKSRIVLKDTPNYDWAVVWNECIKEVLKIIDKYKSESEVEDD